VELIKHAKIKDLAKERMLKALENV